MYNLVPLSDGLPICKNNLPINNISYIAGFQRVVALFYRPLRCQKRAVRPLRCQTLA